MTSNFSVNNFSEFSNVPVGARLPNYATTQGESKEEAAQRTEVGLRRQPSATAHQPRGVGLAKHLFLVITPDRRRLQRRVTATTVGGNGT